MAREVGVIVTIIALIVVYVPTSIYYVWKMYAQTYRAKVFTMHSCIFLRKRYSFLSLIAAISYIIQFFDLSLWIFVYSDWYNKAKLQIIFVSIASTMHFITQFIITLSLTLRFWLIHFRMKFEMMSENHEWKKIINSKYIHDEAKSEAIERAMFDMMHSMEQRVNSTKFILKYKSTVGNHRWCFKRGILIFFLILIMMLFAESMNYKSLNIVPQNLSWIKLIVSCVIYASFGALWSVLLFLHCRSPDFTDSIYIKQELSYILQVMMFFLIIYIVFIVVFGLGLSDSNLYEDHFFDEIIILFNVIGFSNMLMLYITVYYPLKKAETFSEMSDRENSVSREQSMLSMTRSTPRSNPIGYKQKALAGKKIKLDHVLRNKSGYDGFIKHLSSEFSMENLLSLTEFLQFKLYIHRKSPNSVMNKDLRYWLYMLPLDALPRSEIVFEGEIMDMNADKLKSGIDEKHNEDDMVISNSHNQVVNMIMGDLEFVRECKLKAYNLYFKYIKTGCEYEVNISYELRTSYRNLFDDEQQWMDNEPYNDLVKLRDIFDDCCTIMRRMIGHSFQRFKNSRYYDNIEQELVQLQPKALTH